MPASPPASNARAVSTGPLRRVAALASATLLALLLPAAGNGADDDAPERPNIVLVMADDMGWGDPSYNGQQVLKTPNLDQMAASGLRFDRFYAAAPVCSPTRGSALTGRHPHRYGVFYANVGHLPPQEVTLAEAVRPLGYATGFFGKWHLGTLSKTDRSRNRGAGKALVEHFAPPWEAGFDLAFATEAKVPTWDPMVDAGLRRTWWDPLPDPARGKPYGTPYYQNGTQVTGNLEGDDSRIIMDRAIPFIRAAVEKKHPFLAVVWFHAPHLPVVAGEKYTRPYAHLDKRTQHYYGCIAALDEQVGRLRGELRRLGAARDTLLWFCSDNGPEGNAKAPGSTGGLRGRKRSLFEGGIRVPGILEWPARVEPGRATDMPAGTLDYYPTVVELLGLEVAGQPQPVDGVSLMPLIAGKSQVRTRPLPFHSRGTMALVDNRYKLVVSAPRAEGPRRNPRDPGGEAGPLLFDLREDPGERHDLAAEMPDRVQQMHDYLNKWRAGCDASREGRDYR